MRDMHNNVLVGVSLYEHDFNSDETGDGVDLLGFDSAEILLFASRGVAFNNTNHIDFVVEHSDDDSTYTAVGTSDIIGAEGGAVPSSGQVWRVPNGSARTQWTENIGYLGGKRYVRVKAIENGSIARTNTNGNTSSATVTQVYAAVMRGNPSHAPTR